MPNYSEAYLGCLMIDPNCLQVDVPFEAVESSLQPLFRSMLQRIVNGDPIDAINLTMACRKEKWWPGANYVSDLPMFAISKAYVKKYASELKREYKINKLKSWKNIAIQIVGEASDPDETIAVLEEGLAEICERQNHFALPLSKIIEEYEEVGDEMPCIKTGEQILDDAWLLDKGGHHVIASRPGMGKSACACWLVTKFLARDLKTIFFSIEMPRFQILKRLKSIWGTLNNAKNFPLIICDKPALSMESLMMLAQVHKPDVMIIDYLQLIRTRQKFQSREQQVAWISMSLKELARRLECPVITLSQLNREVDSTASKRPMLSHLRESGSIEADADSVVLLYRPEYYLRMQKEDVPADQVSLVEFSIAKQRNRDTSILKCYWNRKEGIWKDWRDVNAPHFDRSKMFNPIFGGNDE